jgi:hypothetical protein
MLNWYTDYTNNINYILNTIDNDIINNNINRLLNKNNVNIIENKILEIENDYNNKIIEIELLYNNKESINNIKMSNSLIILQKELEIIKILTKYTLLNKNLDFKFLLICLILLYEFSEVLRIRLKQKKIVYEKKSNIIFRSSYKFCNFQDNCIYNYNKKSKKICYQDHYVHNMVSCDLYVLLEYICNKLFNIDYSNNLNLNDINYDTNNISELYIKEILKTINTLSYVINHMELELRTKCLYLDEKQWEKNHFINN